MSKNVASTASVVTIAALWAAQFSALAQDVSRVSVPIAGPILGNGDADDPRQTSPAFGPFGGWLYLNSADGSGAPVVQRLSLCGQVERVADGVADTVQPGPDGAAVMVIHSEPLRGAMVSPGGTRRMVVVGADGQKTWIDQGVPVQFGDRRAAVTMGKGGVVYSLIRNEGKDAASLFYLDAHGDAHEVDIPGADVWDEEASVDRDPGQARLVVGDDDLVYGGPLHFNDGLVHTFRLNGDDSVTVFAALPAPRATPSDSVLPRAVVGRALVELTFDADGYHLVSSPLDGSAARELNFRAPDGPSGGTYVATYLTQGSDGEYYIAETYRTGSTAAGALSAYVVTRVNTDGTLSEIHTEGALPAHTAFVSFHLGEEGNPYVLINAAAFDPDANAPELALHRLQRDGRPPDCAPAAGSSDGAAQDERNGPEQPPAMPGAGADTESEDGQVRDPAARRGEGGCSARPLAASGAGEAWLWAMSLSCLGLAHRRRRVRANGRPTF